MQNTFICIVDEMGRVIHKESEKTDPQLIADYLSKMGINDMLIGFERGSLSNYFMTSFTERNIPAVCMDARKLSPILSLKVNKTDKNDARGIASTSKSLPIHCKPQESVNRAVLLSSRKVLVNQQTQLKNSVRGLLKSYGIRLGSVTAKQFSATVMKTLEGHDEIIILSIMSLLNAFDKLLEEIGKLDKKVLATVSRDKEVR